LFVIVVAC